MDWILTAVGLTCFWLAGRKIWWAWYVGLTSQLLWAGYALSTRQYGFLLGVVAYSAVYTNNAIKWTAEHRTKQEENQ
jgi:nicotinamide riboside transporter PnuC